MSEAWTIERVEIRTPEDRKMDWWSEQDEIPSGMVLCVAFGKMDDGRRFVYQTLYTLEAFNTVGEDRARELAEREACPPSDDSSNRVELGFTD